MSKVAEAKQILDALGMPRRQQNENAAYTLLAMAAVGPATPWAEAEQPEVNPHGVIEFARERHGKVYAENTRETIRRQAIHQFVQGGVLERNPGEPHLATNSPRTRYRLTDEALAVVRAFGTSDFASIAGAFRVAAGGGLASRYAKAREGQGIPLTLPGGRTLMLSPGRHNELQRQVIVEFLPRFAPGAVLLYLGDTDHKSLRVEEEALAALGIPVTLHDKLPDVVAYEPGRRWLFLVEAVTSHGPVSPKRHVELEDALSACSAGRVYVSAFLDFREFKRHADQIAWETEVWIAEAPSHLLHYNGDRFYGPRS